MAARAAHVVERADAAAGDHRHGASRRRRRPGPSTSGPPSRPSRSMSVITNAAAAGNRPRASVERARRSPRSSRARRCSPPRWSSPTATGTTAATSSTSAGSAHRRRPHHDAGDAGVGEGLGVVDASARRRRSARPPARRRRRRSRPTAGRFAGSPGPRGVEVDDVDPRRALGAEVGGDGDRVVAVDRLGRVVALAQAHDVAAAQVDRRVQQRHAGTTDERADEVAEQAEAGGGRLLGVELGGEHVAAAGTRR